MREVPLETEGGGGEDLMPVYHPRGRKYACFILSFNAVTSYIYYIYIYIKLKFTPIIFPFF